MQDHVVLLGKKENPYPYIKACDLYVQPSRYEGKCVAVREAQMLAKPVVITDYPTAPSQLENGVDGVIVPLNDEDCAKGILQVIKDQALRERLEENCKMRDYSNANEVKKLYALAQTKQ
jgi:glycosyltransferase involved in cell wall biosynthesis